MVKPGGTGSPARVISATPAPLPPSRSRIWALPSSKRYTHLVVRRREGAPSVDGREARAGAVRPIAAGVAVLVVFLAALDFGVTGIIGPLGVTGGRGGPRVSPPWGLTAPAGRRRRGTRPDQGAAPTTDHLRRSVALETAIFAGGCFWGVEDAFRHLSGVVGTRVGYTGGRTETPTYREVCGHTTGHAEAVEVVYEPTTVTYEDLVTAFFLDIHDPTQVISQGPDVGDQYRSAIFVRDAAQRATAERVRARLDAEGRFRRPIATEITDAPRFWEAEEYHQRLRWQLSL